MTRLAPLKPDEMTDEQRDVVSWFKTELKREPHLTHLTWLRSPELARHILHFGHYLRHQSLDFRKRELAILVTGRVCKSPIEWHLHLPDARKAGIEEDIIKQLASGERPRFERPTDDLVYDVCNELLNGFSLSEATYKRAVDIVGHKELVELIAITGYYVMMAMLIGAFDYQLPEGVKPAFVD